MEEVEVAAVVDHHHLEDLTQAALRTAPRDQATPEATHPLVPAILRAVAIQLVTVGAQAHQAEATRRADPPAAHPAAHPEALLEVQALPPEDQDHHLEQPACLEPELTEELRNWQFTAMHT